MKSFGAKINIYDRDFFYDFCPKNQRKINSKFCPKIKIFKEIRIFGVKSKIDSKL